jgi:hypothetical protein
MSTICKLLNEHGASIASPALINATVSWNVRDGVAQAFDEAGRLIAELRHARPEWIEAGGIRIVGVEPKAPGSFEVQAQAWQYDPR